MLPIALAAIGISYGWNLYSAPSLGPGIKEGLKQTMKRTRQIAWKRAQLESKAIPDRGEGPAAEKALFCLVAV